MTAVPFTYPFRTVILANGAFPQHPVPLLFLQNASRIICCDGAAEALLQYGLEPDFIVGDLDSLSEEMNRRYRDILHHDPDQETNDLTKAVNFCIKIGRKEITILGATGKREDHTLGNISLPADYAENADVQMITDYGVFMPITRPTRFKSFPGQQVSVFTLTPDTVFTFCGLKYLLAGKKISSWWQGSLNEACDDEFEIDMDKGKVLVFREHSDDVSHRRM